MRSSFHGWTARFFGSGLSLALLGMTVGCTGDGANSLPATKTKLPPVRTVTGTLPPKSPAYGNLGTNPNTNGTNSNTVNPQGNTSTSTPLANNSGIMPATRIGGDPTRPETRSGILPVGATPTNPFVNPASFNGPTGTSNSNSQMQPLKNSQHIPAVPASNATAPQNNLTPYPSQNQNGSSPSVPTNNAPAWPNSNQTSNSTSPTMPPVGWTPPNQPNYGNPATTNNSPVNNVPPINYNPVPPVSPAANMSNPPNNLAPIKAPELGTNSRPQYDPSIRPVGAIDPIVVPDNTPAPIMAPSRVISTFPPARGNPVPAPLPVMGDEIPPAPLTPQNSSGLVLPR